MNATRFTLLSLALAAGLLSPPRAMADVRKPDGSPLPALDDLVVLREPGTSRPLVARVAAAGLKARELPAPVGDDNSEAGNPIEFLETFRAAMKSPGSDGRPYYLLVRVYPDGLRVRGVAGWVAERYLVLGNSALEHTATKLRKKAMIINSLDHIREELARVESDPDARFGSVIPRLGPSPRAETTGEVIRLFNVFFVFAEADDHVLIGRRGQFQPDVDPDDPRRVILGWVPRDRVRMWLTREAVSWRPDDPSQAAHRQTPGIVYASARDALNGRYDPTEANRAAARAITAEEPMPSGVYGRPLLYSQMRYPLFHEIDPGDRIPRQFRGNDLMRIGVFSGFIGGRADQMVQEMSEQQLADFQKFLTRIQAETRQVEVLFVVDETQSMEVWFPVVAQTIERIMQQILGQGGRSAGRDLRVAVAYYGDTFGGARPFTTAPLQSIGDAGRRIVREVRGHTVQNGGDPPERVFLGLGRALDGAGFSRSSRKLAILVGDKGNKEVEGDPTLPDLIAKLVPADRTRTPIEFYAIQVGLAEQNYAIKFRDETRALSTRVAEAIKARYPDDPSAGRLSTFTNVIRPEDADQFINPIVERFTALRRRAVRIGDELDGLRLTFGNRISRETEQALIGRGIPIDKLRLVRGAQVFQDGYVWRNNAQDPPLKQVKDYLLLNEGELQRFLELISGLDQTTDSAGWTSIEQFIRNMVRAMGGELDLTDRSTTLDDLLRKATGLTLTSPMFKRVIADIRNASTNAQELADIRWKRLVLKDILAAQSRVYTTQRKGDGSGEVWTEHVASDSAAKYMPRGFYFPGDDTIKWYWIDLENEWP
jgi:hypothetical protein